MARERARTDQNISAVTKKLRCSSSCTPSWSRANWNGPGMCQTRNTPVNSSQTTRRVQQGLHGAAESEAGSRPVLPASRTGRGKAHRKITAGAARDTTAAAQRASAADAAPCASRTGRRRPYRRATGARRPEPPIRHKGEHARRAGDARQPDLLAEAARCPARTRSSGRKTENGTGARNSRPTRADHPASSRPCAAARSAELRRSNRCRGSARA